eukprot:COSAG04_NODE_397_length_14976_cov_7.007663_8_plen_278_part_00
MAAMVEHGHAQGVKVGFYQVSLLPPPPPLPLRLTLRAFAQDNCRCHECQDHDHCWDVDAHYAQDANLTESLNFDGLKIDSCGNQRDMSRWAALFAKPGRHDLMVESCGNGPEGTDPKHAAYTGPDYLGIAPSWCAQPLGERPSFAGLRVCTRTDRWRCAASGARCWRTPAPSASTASLLTSRLSSSARCTTSTARCPTSAPPPLSLDPAAGHTQTVRLDFTACRSVSKHHACSAGGRCRADDFHGVADALRDVCVPHHSSAANQPAYSERWCVVQGA